MDGKFKYYLKCVIYVKSSKQQITANKGQWMEPDWGFGHGLGVRRLTKCTEHQRKPSNSKIWSKGVRSIWRFHCTTVSLKTSKLVMRKIGENVQAFAITCNRRDFFLCARSGLQ
jgi:hypothetical protein